MRGQQRQEPQLGRGERRWAGGTRLDRSEPGLQPVSLRGESTEVRPLLENAVGLRQDRRRTRAIGERDVAMRHLQKCLDGHYGQHVGEQGPEQRGAPQVETAL